MPAPASPVRSSQTRFISFGQNPAGARPRAGARNLFALQLRDRLFQEAVTVKIEPDRHDDFALGGAEDAAAPRIQSRNGVRNRRLTEKRVCFLFFFFFFF